MFFPTVYMREIFRKIMYLFQSTILDGKYCSYDSSNPVAKTLADAYTVCEYGSAAYVAGWTNPFICCKDNDFLNNDSFTLYEFYPR